MSTSEALSPREVELLSVDGTICARIVANVNFPGWPNLIASATKKTRLDNGQLKRDTRPTDLTAWFDRVGKLRAFSLEVVQMMLDRCDLQTLTNMRATNSTVRALIDTLPSYKRIFEHSPDTIRAMLMTNMAIKHSINDILTEFEKPNCTTCGEPGFMLHLWTCERTCLKCGCESEDNRVMALSTAVKYFGLSAEAKNELHVLHVLPGRYSERCDTPGSVRVVQLAPLLNDIALRYGRIPKKVTNAVDNQDRKNRKLFWPMMVYENTYRFMSMVPFPVYNKSEKTCDQGMACKYCAGAWRSSCHKVWFSEQKFRLHVEQCPDARKALNLLRNDLARVAPANMRTALAKAMRKRGNRVEIQGSSRDRQN